MATWYGWCDSTGGTSTMETWGSWVTTTSSATTASNATVDMTWVVWTTGSGTGTATYSNATATWNNWITIDPAAPYVDERTPDQRTADEARWAAEREANAQRAAEAEAARKLARDKARTLLLSMLDTKQREQLQREQFFEVISRHSRRRYRIRQGSHGNVRLLNEDGREITSYCAQPNGVPPEDSMLAQKLQLEHDEENFLRVANATRLTA